MHGWKTRKSPTDRSVHTTRTGFGHAILAPVVAYTFQMLRVSAALWEHGAEWFPIHTVASVTQFEYQSGLDTGRHAYNRRMLTEVARRRSPQMGEHAGFADLFVPVRDGACTAAVLVVGPFLRQAPTSGRVLALFRWLTGRQGHTTDPEFASYLSATLDTPRLEGKSLRAFQQTVECIAALMSGSGAAGELASRAERLRPELERVRLPERMWEVVAEMLDDRSMRSWHTSAASAGLGRLGLSRVPDDVLVGLTGRARGTDPVEEVIRRDALQRRAVELAHETGNVVAGRVGGHGVVFLASSVGSRSQRQKVLRALASRVAAAARRDLGLSLHWGMGAIPERLALVGSYQAALTAAEAALGRNVALLTAEVARARAVDSLRLLRHELARTVEEQPDRLGARFDRYVEAVLAQAGHAPDACRGHLDAGFDWMAGQLVRRGTLDERSFLDLSAALEHAAADARSFGELVDAYRRAVADMSDAVRRPEPARRERSVRRAVEYIEQHYAEPLPLATVARVAGMARVYFSKLFKKTEGTTFEHYLRRLRLERAQQLLTNTGLATARVAEMCGFRSSTYFCRVFHRATGLTPGAYRTMPASSRGRIGNKVLSKGNGRQRPA